MPNTTTATELQRNYSKVLKKAKSTKRPLTILSNNKPELVIIDYDVFKNRVGKSSKRPKETNSFNEFLGVWSKKEADEFDRVIEEMFEQVNPKDWE